MTNAKNMRHAILEELERQEAIGPEQAVDAMAVRQSLGALVPDFEKALEELTSMERVGVVAGQLYLRRNVP